MLFENISTLKSVGKKTSKDLKKSLNFTITLLMKTKISKKLFYLYGPQQEKTCLRGFQQSQTQTSLLSYGD